MRVVRLGGAFLFFVLGGMLAAGAASAEQDELAVNTAINGPVLTFDWPAVQIGIGSSGEDQPGWLYFVSPTGYRLRWMCAAGGREPSTPTSCVSAMTIASSTPSSLPAAPIMARRRRRPS